jgi:hypothetical protein
MTASHESKQLPLAILDNVAKFARGSFMKVRGPWTKAIDILAQTVQLSTAAARCVVDTAFSRVQPQLDKLSNAEGIRLPIIAREIRGTRPKFAHEKEQSEREPMFYYTWLGTDGKVSPGQLQHISVAQLLEMIGCADNMGFKIESEETPEGDIVKRLDFSVATEDVEDQLRLAQQFLDKLISQDSACRVFKTNPYFREERIVHRKMIAMRPFPFDVGMIAPEDEFDGGILFVPDFHNEEHQIPFVEETLKKGQFDWLAIEMFPHTMQASIDQFLDAPTKNEALEIYRAELKPHLKENWDSYLDIPEDSEGPYYDLLETCRELNQQRDGGFRVIGINSTSDYYLSNYNWHEHGRLIFATRNLIWAKHIPQEGKGIVFGGWQHFLRPKSHRVQDFIGEMDKDRNIERKMRIVNFGGFERTARYHFRFTPW